MRFENVMELPEGWDSKTRLLLVDANISGRHGMIVATHPKKHPLLIDVDAGTIEPLKAAR